jgi:hypothetical protein
MQYTHLWTFLDENEKIIVQVRADDSRDRALAIARASCPGQPIPFNVDCYKEKLED